MAQAPVNTATRKIFLTAEDLERRIRSAGSGLIELAANEYLTPRAKDLADEKSIAVRRTVTATDAPITQPVIKSDKQQAVQRLTDLSARPADRAVVGAVGLVIERATENVVVLLQALRHDGPVFVDCSQAECWLRNTEALAGQIKSGALAAGVLLVPYAANAMLLAGKIKGLRPVQGTRVASVAAAVRHFDANVLVLEHRLCTFHQMRAMVRAFTAARPGAMNRDVMATVAKLEQT